MTTTAAFRGRLPGLVCDPALAPRTDDAIRLDLAAFVGFAERGPVDDPQLIADPAQYAAIFGGDLQLALDEHGDPVHAQLPSAVQTFFDNGGRRAYVVRVAPGAYVHPVVARVVTRVPVLPGRAIVDLNRRAAIDDTVPAAAGLLLVAGTPGGWGRRLSVDVVVRDRVLEIRSEAGSPALTQASIAMIDPGDVVTVERAGVLRTLVTPEDTATITPDGGWRSGDVARRVRIDLVVRMAIDGHVETVETLRDLRLGPGRGRSRCWRDAIQPPSDAGRTPPFDRARSPFLRAATDTGTPLDLLVPVPGAIDLAVPRPDEAAIPEPATRAALDDEGLTHFAPVELFTAPAFRDRTIESLRIEIDRLATDGPNLTGLHALASTPDVAIIAIPDLTHRPWTVQAVAIDADPVSVPPAATPDDGQFATCATPGDVPPLTPPPTGDDAARRMVLDPPDRLDPTGFHAVARDLVGMCAARGDAIAVLGLPRHAGVSDAEHLADAIRSRTSGLTDVASHGGIWHPWGAILEPDPAARRPVRPVSPVGAAAGLIAASELERGWWVEPAGRPIAGYLGVDPSPDAIALFERGINVLRRTAAGHTTTSAHSCSSDRSWLQLSVRRLVIWVRLLALREGSRYVFEPNGERLRAQITATFRRHLDRLVTVGALHAHDVEIDPNDGDAGRVTVAVKLAPSSPIEFITVTLLRSGEQLAFAEAGR